ncbi:MAG: twin-arginine translocase TatA/TatE family subunit [Muribaculaceae bacterium]|nr:twin-arginine translocase TatA/TatE family subunit [Muribaculaceae bacterium]
MTDALIPLFFGINGSEWIIILIIVLLLFGGKKIPELMRGLGKGVKSFKDGVEDAKRELNTPADKNEDKTTEK